MLIHIYSYIYAHTYILIHIYSYILYLLYLLYLYLYLYLYTYYNDRKFQNSPIHEAKYWHYNDPVRLNEIWDISKNIGRRFTDEGIQYKINRIVIYESDPQEWLFYEYYEEKYDDEKLQIEDMHYTRCDHFEGGKYYGTMPGQKEDWFRWYDDDDDDDDDCNVDA